MRGKSCLLASSFVVFSLLVVLSPTRAQDARSVFKEGYSLYRQGDYDGALSRFKEVLDQSPSGEEALWMRDQLPWAVWSKMLADKGEGSKIAARVLELATTRMKEMRRDDAAIQTLVGELRGSDFGARLGARRRLASEHGAFAVPALLPALASEGDDDFRIEAMFTLTSLRSAAVLPLMAALRSENEFQKANVASVLGNIRDWRALPGLAAAHELGGSDFFQLAVADAVEKLGEVPAGSASSHYVALADLYYHKSPEVLREVIATKFLWEWEGGNVVPVEVPSFLYPFLLAESFCHDALALNPNEVGGWALLVKSWLGQAAVIEARRSGEDDDPMNDLAQRLAKTRALAAAAGIAVLDAVVRSALDPSEGDAAVAIEAIKLLGQIVDPGSFAQASGSLTAALVDGNKRTRFAAAIALARIRPQGPFAGNDRVVVELVRALGEAGERLVLVISGDDTVRNQLVATIEGARAGISSVGVRSGLAGIARAKTFPSFDAVVCDVDLPDVLASKVLDELKADYRTSDVPVVMLCRANQRTVALNSFSARVQGLVVHDSDEAETVRSITDALPIETTAARLRALALASNAAEALADLSRALVGSTLTLDDTAARGIKRALALADAVRVPAITALGNLAFAPAQADLAAILANTGNSVVARSGAARALGRLAQGGVILHAESLNALKAGLSESDSAIAQGCGGALGFARLDGAVRAAMLSDQRLAPSSVFEGVSQ